MTIPLNPVEYIDDQEVFEKLCVDLMSESVLGLDVETTIAKNPVLCTIQFANETNNYVIDVLALEDVSPVEPVLSAKHIVKVIHYAAFEKKVLGSYGYTINNIFDTCAVSRTVRRPVKGHSLLAVCNREISVELDKQWQKSDWTTRPLLPAQLHYAALDAEVLIRLYHIFKPLVSSGGVSSNKPGKVRSNPPVLLFKNPVSQRKRLTSGPSLPVSFSRGEVFECIRQYFGNHEKTSLESLVMWIGDMVSKTPLKSIESAVIRGFITDAQSFRLLSSENNYLNVVNLKLEDYDDSFLSSLLVKLLDRATAVKKTDAVALFLAELGFKENPGNLSAVEKYVSELVASEYFVIDDDVLSCKNEGF